MTNDYSNKQVLITGGSSGIGLALAKIMAANGAHVWILARRMPELEAACQDISESRKSTKQRVGIIQANIADREQIFTVLEEHAERNGTPDLLVNNAGITYPGLFSELKMEVFDQLMQVNYFGTLNVTKALLPGMIARRSGHIAIVGSMAGILGAYGYSAYGASKYALRCLADVMRVELREHNILTSYIIPLDTQTPQLEFEKDLKPPITNALVSSNSTVLSADEVARIMYKGLVNRKHMITTGGESSLFYNLSNTFGIVYPLMDFFIGQAHKKVARSKSNGGK